MATDRIECTIVKDVATGKVLFRDGPCEQRYSPFSTFKIPLSLMGYDSGILVDAHNPTWDYSPEFEASSEREKKTVDPTIWLDESIVWFSRQITIRLGAERFQGYVNAFDYGNRDVSAGLSQSWLGSSLTISPDEQVVFLEHMLGKSPIVSDHSYDMTFTIMPSFEAVGGWSVHGKTGSGWLREAGGEYDTGRPQGWFTGWADRGERRVVFARLEIGNVPSEEYGGKLAKAALLESLHIWART